MSFLFADRKKQIAVVNKPTDSNNAGLFVTGSLDLLNQASVTGLANSTLVGNLTEAANLIYPNSRGSLTYYDGLVIEGLPHIALSPVMGTASIGGRDKGVGIGLGFSETSAGVRTYTKPTAVLDILGTNADVKITGGALSTSGTASLIMVGSKANPGTVSGFKIDVERTTADPTIGAANMYIRPYDINTVLPALISMNHEGNVGIGTSSANSSLHVVSSLPSVGAVFIQNLVGPGLTIKTGSSVAGSSYPLRVITEGGTSGDNISLYVTNEGKVGIKMDPTNVSDVKNNLALAVNGSIRATNIVFAYGTFSYANDVFAKKDTYNVDSVEIPTNADRIKIFFLDNIVNFESQIGYTVLVSETSGKPVIPYVSEKAQNYVVIQFLDLVTGDVGAKYTEFSFAIFSNTGSIYQEASLTQLVF
jgi:hypothetical protein